MSSLRNNYPKVSLTTPTNRVRRLTDDGTGVTGISNMIGNYSVTPKVFWIQPPIGVLWTLQEVGLVVNGVANGQLADYGSIAGGLTNGIKFFLEIDGQEIDVTGSSNFKTNSDIVSNGGRFNGMEFGGSKRLDSIWFPQLPDTEVVVLDGDKNMKFGIRLNDNFTTLIQHGFYIRAEDYGQKSR